MLTNKNNLPASLVRAIENDTYKKVGDISVTELINPPRIRVLRKRHAQEIIEDVNEKIWILLGRSVHSILEKGESQATLTEERLCLDVCGWTLSGQPDLLEKDVLYDYKVTSVWSVINGPKEDWIKQLNCYRFLYSHYGFIVNDLKIVAILRDWSKNKALAGGNYPQSQVVVLPVPFENFFYMEEYIETRLEYHKAAEKVTDDDLPECTPQETWEKPSKWAIMKNGRKSAVKLCNNAREAETLISQGLGQYIEYRPGNKPRCEQYCNVAPFCCYAPRR